MRTTPPPRPEPGPADPPPVGRVGEGVISLPAVMAQRLSSGVVTLVRPYDVAPRMTLRSHVQGGIHARGIIAAEHAKRYFREDKFQGSDNCISRITGARYRNIGPAN
ncbi:hypothetical protein Aph01nite_28870 [Acrocarpospora phusangensis]|uniref:Uncharacterized protein n=1 Tax=Acrocarpospora phusangensis TaxID=1070424 RepID=A0A919Q925_9ACTN|nr:hypothetical protein Aph01nite_28870 [Acrocarpospora phusangensis]